MKNVVALDTDIFTVADVFDAGACRELIARGEGLGFEAASVATAAGAQMLTHIRNNDRVTWEDAAFTADLWSRVRAYVPQEMNGFGVVGLNPRLRFYRYDVGQRFKRHQDGRVQTAEGWISRLSFLIYLNEEYTGGETKFRDYTHTPDGRLTNEIVVVPQTGMGLFFAHERKHEGAPLLSGRKYLLRTDVLYAGAPEAENAVQESH